MNDVLSQPTDQDALALTHAIALQESGKNGVPNYNAVGDNGTSKGAYQWQPGNFEAAAKNAGLDPTDFSPENQDKVAYSEIKAYKDKGYDPGQIASLWNSGSPNNWQNHSGTTTINGKAISYDTPAYVKGVQQYYQQIKQQSPSPSQASASSTATPQKPSLLSSLGNDASTALGGAGQALADTESGKINPLSGILQGVGSIAGGVSSAVNDAATHLPVVGGLISGTEGLLGKGIQAAANTGVGQSLAQGAGNFAADHPEIAGDIGAAGNIAGLAGLATGAGSAVDAAGGLLGKALGKDALSSTIDAISPEIKAGTKAGAANVAKNGVTKDAFGNITRNVDPNLKQAAAVVKEVSPNFDSLPTFTDKYNAVDSGITKLAQNLQSNLSSPEIQPILTQEDLANLQKGVDTQIEQNPLLTGDAGIQAQKIFNQFKRLLPQQGDITMSDVLSARKQLDSWIQGLKGSSAFDPKMENALSVGLRAVRQGANNLMEAKVPDAGVKALLRKQSLLYDALDNLAPKADKEVGTGILKRAVARHPSVARAAKYTGGAILGGLGLSEGQKLLGG